jgi:hypothetical protein
VSELLNESNKKQRLGTPIIVVSGLPRSGTSMMMRMLGAGGIEILTDNLREADEDNLKGYYELEKVKTLSKDVDKSWLEEAKGKAVKIISALLKGLPQTYFYKVIFMNRNLDEVIASQDKMLTRRNERRSVVEDDKLKLMFEKHLQSVESWLSLQSNFDVLNIKYNDVLDNPTGNADRVKEFLQRELAIEEMAAVVNKQLYRNRF